MNQLAFGDVTGDVEGVVMIVDTDDVGNEQDDRNDNQDLERGSEPALEVGDEGKAGEGNDPKAEQAAHALTGLRNLTCCLLRSPPLHSTLDSSDCNNSTSRRLRVEDLLRAGLPLRCIRSSRERGKRGPCMLLRTSVKETHRESSKAGVEK